MFEDGNGIALVRGDYPHNPHGDNIALAVIDVTLDPPNGKGELKFLPYQEPLHYQGKDAVQNAKRAFNSHYVEFMEHFNDTYGRLPKEIKVTPEMLQRACHRNQQIEEFNERNLNIGCGREIDSAIVHNTTPGPKPGTQKIDVDSAISGVIEKYGKERIGRAIASNINFASDQKDKSLSNETKTWASNYTTLREPDHRLETDRGLFNSLAQSFQNYESIQEARHNQNHTKDQNKQNQSQDKPKSSPPPTR